MKSQIFIVFSLQDCEFIKWPDRWAPRSGRREPPRTQVAVSQHLRCPWGRPVLEGQQHSERLRSRRTRRTSGTKSCRPVMAAAPREHQPPLHAGAAVGCYTAINMTADGGSRAGPPSVTSSTHQPLKPMTRESTVQKCHPEPIWSGKM